MSLRTPSVVLRSAAALLLALALTRASAGAPAPLDPQEPRPAAAAPRVQSPSAPSLRPVDDPGDPPPLEGPPSTGVPFLSELSFLTPPAEAVPCNATVRYSTGFDQIGCYQLPGGRQVWTIYQPNPTVGAADYGAIRIRQGDRVTVAAGGCVDNGGTAGWRRYVRPENVDRSLDGQHFGSLSINGFYPQTRLLDVLRGGPIEVTANPGTNAFLRLHFADSNLSDNRYGSVGIGPNEQCVGLENAWVTVVVQPNCAGSTSPSCSSASPMDLVVPARDSANLAIDGRWGWQELTGAWPVVFQLCSLSYRSLAAPEDNLDLCTRQPAEKNNNPTKCPLGTLGDPGPAGRGTPGRIGGHVNWAASWYEGRLRWEKRQPSTNDFDENIFFSALSSARPIPQALPEAPAAQAEAGLEIEMEYDSRETTRRAQSPFWRRLNDAVGQGDSFAGALLDGRRAIVLGLVGVDCAHNCPAELHPVYAMAVHVNNGQPESFSTPFDDQWAFFGRNYGNEGYCGGQDRPLVNGFGRQGLQLQDYSLLIPEPPDGPYSSFRLREGSQLSSTNTALSQTVLTKVQGGLLLTFHLGSPANQQLVDGDLRIEWIR